MGTAALTVYQTVPQNLLCKPYDNRAIKQPPCEIDRGVDEMFERLVGQMAQAEGITEGLKTANQMAWVGKMNSVRNRAMEIVNADLIYV